MGLGEDVEEGRLRDLLAVTQALQVGPGGRDVGEIVHLGQGAQGAEELSAEGGVAGNGLELVKETDEL